MVLASRLTDGRVVFLAPAGPTGPRWVETIADGVLATSKDEANALLAAAQAAEVANVVVEPYLIEVTEQDGRRRPVAWREVIRAEGPTVRTDGAPADRAEDSPQDAGPAVGNGRFSQRRRSE